MALYWFFICLKAMAEAEAALSPRKGGDNG